MLSTASLFFMVAISLTTTTILASPLPAPNPSPVEVVSPRQPTTALQIIRLSSIENLAIRSSGHILATNMNSPALLSIDPVAKTSSPALTIPGVSGLSGIVEYAPDLFAVIGGGKGIYTIDFTVTPPTSSLITMIPEAGNLNGLSTFVTNESILVGDAGKGVVYRLDIYKRTYEQVIKHSTMAPPSGSGIPFGIDGLRHRASDRMLWYTNIFKNSFHRVALDPVTGKMAGSVTTLWTNLMGDDLCFGPEVQLADGTWKESKKVYMATNGRNSLVEVDTSQLKPSPKVVATVGGSMSCAVGRGEGDKGVVYVSGAQGIYAVRV